MATSTLTEQIHLVNIITLAQDRLQTNFKSIVNRLKAHDNQLVLQADQMKKVQLELNQKILDKQQQKNQQIKNLSEKIQRCFTLINQLASQSKSHIDLINGCQKDITKNSKQITDLSSIFEQKIDQNKNQVDEVELKLQKLQKDLYKAYEQILKKQDSTQVMKIHKSIDNTKEKVDKNQKQFKVLEHKLQKIQILNQKTERNQGKKQLELMKQIQQKIKREMKGLHRSLSKSVQRPLQGENDISNPNPPENILRQTIYGRQNRLSLKMEEQQAALVQLKSNFQKIAISKMNQKIENFENKLKTFQNSMNNFMINNKKNNKPESQQIKQRINELKPELIKLWTKCDTIEDRIAFNERKFQQKSKILSNLLDTQKQNGVGRLDQKFKAFQTQIYTTLKQLKNKVDAKVNSHEYEKQSIAIEQKLKQITDHILLKSDKLEVKKALLFLQSKIKQIILVISQDQEIEKDALLTKKQLKCISCDKDIDKMSKFATTAGRGNWDALPNKEHSPQMLGKFGMTGFGSLSKKLKKLESKDLPILKSRKNGSSILQPITNTIQEADKLNESK